MSPNSSNTTGLNERRSFGVQPAGCGLEVLVGRAGSVGGTDAAVESTWRYSQRPLACPAETEPQSPRAAGYTGTFVALLVVVSDLQRKRTRNHESFNPNLLLRFAQETPGGTT